MNALELAERLANIRMFICRAARRLNDSPTPEGFAAMAELLAAEKAVMDEARNALSLPAQVSL